MSRYARYCKNNLEFLVKIEKFLVALTAGKSLGTCQKRSSFAIECSKMRCRCEAPPQTPLGGGSLHMQDNMVRSLNMTGLYYMAVDIISLSPTVNSSNNQSYILFFCTF